MSLLEKVNKVDNKYHSPKFRRAIEDHLTLLRKDVTANAVGSDKGLQFKNNYYGLLAALAVQPKYRYVVMRVNKITNPKLSGVVGTVYLPNFKTVDTLIGTLNLAERNLF